jgi:hypothetical protein
LAISFAILCAGTGADGNSSFTISGSSLLTAASFDYETTNSYSIRVQSSDQGALYFEKQFTITVNNVSVPPIFGTGGTVIITNHITFCFTGEAGSKVVIERCLNLSPVAVWTSLATNTLGAAPSCYTDPGPATNSQCYYRLRVQ